MSYTLSIETQDIIEKKLGISFKDILETDAVTLDKKIEDKIGKPLKAEPIRDERLMSRGSVYLFLERFLCFNTKKLDRYIDKIK